MSWTEIEEEKRQEYIDDSVEHAISDYGNSVLYSSARNEYMIERMKRLLTRTIWALTKQLEAGDFVPVAYEMRLRMVRLTVWICAKTKTRSMSRFWIIRPGARPLMWWLYIMGSSFSLMVIYGMQQ